jgi:hypothetical protein
MAIFGHGNGQIHNPQLIPMVGFCKICTKMMKLGPRQLQNPSMTAMACPIAADISTANTSNNDVANQDNDNITTEEDCGERGRRCNKTQCNSQPGRTRGEWKVKAAAVEGGNGQWWGQWQ